MYYNNIILQTSDLFFYNMYYNNIIYKYYILLIYNSIHDIVIFSKISNLKYFIFCKS